jgi:hypothetical protein
MTSTSVECGYCDGVGHVLADERGTIYPSGRWFVAEAIRFVPCPLCSTSVEPFGVAGHVNAEGNAD